MFTSKLLKKMLIALLLVLCIILKTEGYWMSEEDEKEALDEFKEMALPIIADEPFMKEDAYLMRWLRFYGFDIENTFAKLEQTMAWRRENNMSTILYENFTTIYYDYPLILDGSKDLDGRPLLQVSIGHHNLRRITLAGQKDAYLRNLALMLDMTEKYIYYLTKAENLNISQAIFINDMQGFNLVSTGCWNCMGLIPEIIPLLDKYYPALFYRLYFINTPKIFDTMLNLMKSIMAESTKDTLQVFDSRRERWQTAIFEHISPDELTTVHGGNKVLVRGASVKNKLVEYFDSVKEQDEQIVMNVLNELPAANHHELPAEEKNETHHQHHHHYAIPETHVNITEHKQLIEITEPEKGVTNAYMEVEEEVVVKKKNKTTNTFKTRKSEVHKLNETENYKHGRSHQTKTSDAKSNFSTSWPPAILTLCAILTRIIWC